MRKPLAFNLTKQNKSVVSFGVRPAKQRFALVCSNQISKRFKRSHIVIEVNHFRPEKG
jgi:hypothetical protein